MKATIAATCGLAASLVLGGCMAGPTSVVTVTATPEATSSATADETKTPQSQSTTSQSPSPSPASTVTQIPKTRMPYAYPSFGASPSKERVEACRASEAAFAASPEAIGFSENGQTTRIPSYEEYELAREAWRRASDLEDVEPGLSLMTNYWWDQSSLLGAATTGDRKLVRKALNPGNFLIGGNGQPVDFWGGIELLNDACAAVGSVTNFSELPTHQPPDWYLELDQ